MTILRFVIVASLMLAMQTTRAANGTVQVPLRTQSLMVSFDDESSDVKVTNLVGKMTDKNTSVISVQPEMKKQPLIGFGGNLTQASVTNLNKLNPAERKRILEKIFSKKKGYGLSYLRVPMGVTDFSDPANGNFSYDDTDGNGPDLDLKNFSIDKDEPTLSLLHEIETINPELRIMLTSWSPPAWMKSSKSFKGGKLLPEFREVYARYLVRAVEEYMKRGFRIDAISMQNEPGVWWKPFIATGFKPEEQGLILAQYFGPALRKLSPETKIFALDHNWGMYDQVQLEIQTVPEAENYIDGIAFHCYGGGVADIEKTRTLFPRMLIYQTECSPYDSQLQEHQQYFRSWIRDQVIEGIRAGASTGLAWNIALDQYDGPHQSYCHGCRGLIKINTELSIVTAENPELKALGLGSKFTGLETYVISSSTQDADLGQVAFVNNDGTKVIVVTNRGAKLKKVRVADSEHRDFSFDLPPDHTISLRWN